MKSETLVLRDMLIEILKEASGVEAYADGAPQEAEYPYIVFTKRVLAPGMPALYMLEVSVWDEYVTYSRVDTIMDNVEKALNRVKMEENNLKVWIYNGQRDYPEDENKKIKRCREQYSMKTAGRS